MSQDFWSTLFVFVLASIIGLGVIRRVSRLLHTPLMSLTNAISAISVVGAILMAGGDNPIRIRILGAIALFASMTNIVSGFLITDRMLKMFKAPPQGRRQGCRGPLVIDALSQLTYIVASVLFIFALHWMNAPDTARKGVYAGVAATALAILVTWAEPSVVNHLWIVLPLLAGVAVGVPLSRVPLTAVPQRTALSHAFGGIAAGLVGTAEYYLRLSEGPEWLTPFRMVALIVEIILGYLTFTGSLMAAGKLQEVKWVPQRPVTYTGQNAINALLLAAAVGIASGDRDASRGGVGAVSLSRHHPAGAAVRRAAHHPDRRRRHADGHRDPECLRRAVGGGHGVRARQQAPDHGGRA